MSVVVVFFFCVAANAGFDDAFARARADYDDVELDRAARGFHAAAALADDDDDRARALLWAGVASGQAGDVDDARVSFEAALALDRGAALPTTVSPKVKALFDDARAALPPPRAPPKPPPTPTPPSSTTTTTETPPKPAPEPSSTSALPVLLTAGGAAIALVSAGVAVKAAVDIGVAADPATPQPAARDLLDQGNLELAIAGTAAVVGLVVGGVGVLLLSE